MRIHTWLVAALCAMSTPALAEWPPARCEKPQFQKAAEAVVSIHTTFLKPVDGFTSADATAWFIAPNRLVTVSHVTDNALDSTERTVTLSYATSVRTEPSVSVVRKARLIASIGTGLPQSISVIEIDEPIKGRTVLKVRAAPVQKGEPIFGVGYRSTEGPPTLKYAVGYYTGFREPDPEDEPSSHPSAPFLPFEIANEKGEDRYVFDHGASGSPLLDCSGAVVSVTNAILVFLMDNFRLASSALGLKDEPLRVTTPWGMPNVLGVPAGVLVQGR